MTQTTTIILCHVVLPLILTSFSLAAGIQCYRNLYTRIYVVPNEDLNLGYRRMHIYIDNDNFLTYSSYVSIQGKEGMFILEARQGKVLVK